MNQIPIKIKSDSAANQQDIKKALNLNQLLNTQAKLMAKNKSKFWLTFGFFLILTLILLALVANLFWSKPKSFGAYENLIPEQTQAVIFLKIYELKNLSPAIIPSDEQNASFYQWLKNRILQFLADLGVSAESDLWPLFQEQAAFLILPDGAGQKISWLVFAETKPSQELQKQIVFNKIEQGLRKDFGLSQLFYRQIKINVVQPLNQLERRYFYAQVNNFVIISNNQTNLENLIDRIIKR